MKKLICIALLLTRCGIGPMDLVVAQSNQVRFSATTGDVSLSAAGTTLTVQQPATNAKEWRGEIAWVYCSVACNVTQAINGTAATTTAATLAALPPYPNLPASVVSVFSASNVGAGTAIGGILHVPAGSTITIDLSLLSLPRGGSGTNYSISVSSITGTANISVIGSQPQ